jgi:hypothetical protein
VKTLEEVNKMPYITSVERIGRAEGLQEGLQQGLRQGLRQELEGLQQVLLEALGEQFGTLPAPVSDAIHQIQDPAQLRLLILQAIRSESLAEFQRHLDQNISVA